MPRRFHPPDRLPGATNFSRDRELSGSLNLVRLLKRQAWVADELRAQVAALAPNWARRREPGRWELVAVAFVCSGQVDIQPFYDAAGAELWRECGFQRRPSYITVWRRLRELSEHHDLFLEAVAKVVQHARRHDGRVGAHVHVDCTEDETHASPVHDCGPDDDCRVRGLPDGARGRRAPGRGRRARRVSTERARAERQTLNTLAPDEASARQAAQAPEREELVERDGRTYKRFRWDGCWFITRDTDAGVRAYVGPRGARRSWHGYYNAKAVDHFTGAPLYVGVESASTMEFDLFAPLYEQLRRVIGATPQSVVGDKGFSVAKVFETCTSNGTAPVFPWRPGNGQGRRHDKLTHDRHGIPRCKHCGGPSEFVRFSANGGRPRLWFRCMTTMTVACRAGDQSISCSKDWRLLVPLWRTDALYHELKASHDSFEGAHDYWRDRYRVAADTLANRPKVCSIAFHRLRAHVATLIEWLRVCAREGWLGSARRNHRDPVRRGERRGVAIARALAGMRQRMGLTAPYGPKAAALGVSATPPSRRGRPAPPGDPPDR